MAWITLTDDSLLSRLTSDERDKITTLGNAGGQSSPVFEEIQRVSNKVRGAIPKWIQRGSDYSVPSELEDAALSLIVFRLCSRIPTKLLLTDARVADSKNAEEELAACRRGEVSIEAPDVPSTVSVQQPGAAFRGHRPHFGRHQEYGV